MTPSVDEREVAVLGLGASGCAAAALLIREGRRVYASDASPTSTAGDLARFGSAITIDSGRHDLDRIRAAAFVVASPGIPPSAPPLRAALDAGVPVISEIELALRAMPGLRYIAVTGTNGKTTTTALIGHLLRALGHDAVEAGNIGVPLAEVALRAVRPAWVALEVSSFQLHDSPGIDPTVGVLTNLAPDHLDRYDSVAAYYADKAHLFDRARAGSRHVLNADDAAVQALVAGVPGRRYTFSTVGAASAVTADAAYVRTEGQLDLLGRPWMARSEVPMLGDHNVANVLAAALAVSVADVAHETPSARATLADAVRGFRPPPHRLQLVGEFDGVQWIDDSKATNVGAAAVALGGMTRPTIWLAGGRHKGEPYTALAEPLRRVARAVLAYGEAAPLNAHDLESFVPLERLGSDFRAVVDRARALARPGDAVLLAPACSSFDMFRDYRERGDTFARLAAGGAD
jgi:UDP-N-acetylmuramoylalanine--D-glutamate ligase